MPAEVYDLCLFNTPKGGTNNNSYNPSASPDQVEGEVPVSLEDYCSGEFEL